MEITVRLLVETAFEHLLLIDERSNIMDAAGPSINAGTLTLPLPNFP